MTAIADGTSNVASTLIDALIASNRGDHHAFTYAQKRYSYQDVAALMNRTGNMVRTLGVAKGALVLLLLPGSPALVASLLGVIKAGAVPVLGAPLDGAGALAHCVATTRASAAIVHQVHLPAAESGLSAISRDAIVVVGADAHGYKSFLEEVRGQPSWLAAQDMKRDAPALGLWNGSALETMSHAELTAYIAGSGDVRASLGTATGVDTTALAAMLRAFSKGEEATLP